MSTYFVHVGAFCLPMTDKMLSFFADIGYNEHVKKRGRPTTVEKRSEGRPGLYVRMEATLLAWVKSNGGPSFLRDLAEKKREEESNGT